MTLMRLLSFLCLLHTIGFHAPAAFAQSSYPAPTQVLTSATGRVTLPPDWALLRIGISASDNRAARASAIATARIRSVIDTLVSLGFFRDSVAATYWTVGPTYEPEGRRVTGYSARGVVQVRVRQLPRLGELIDAALAAGATDIQGVDSHSDSTETARLRALATAFRDARAQAEALVAAAGSRLGRLVIVSTEAGRASVMEAITVQAGFVSTPPLTPGDVIVQATVYARWEVLPPGN